MRHLWMILPLLIAGCDSVQRTSETAANITHNSYNNAISSWTDVFTYHPRPPAQGPQTRYCYNSQSDIVCYDSVQANQTGRLIGYQDGDMMSWVQPGGGSLGASGGSPTSPRHESGVQVAPTSTSEGAITISDAPSIGAPTIIPAPASQPAVVR